MSVRVRGGGGELGGSARAVEHLGNRLGQGVLLPSDFVLLPSCFLRAALQPLQPTPATRVVRVAPSRCCVRIHYTLYTYTHTYTDT